MSTFIINQGDLYACGSNQYSQLGLDDFLNRNAFVPNNITKEQGISFAAVSSMDEHTIALDSEGNLWACGNNSFSQLGLGSELNMSIVKMFVKVIVVDPCTSADVYFTNIACADIHSVAIDTEGNLWDTKSEITGEATFFTKISCKNDYSSAYKLDYDPVFTSICCGFVNAYALDSEGYLWHCNYQNTPSIFNIITNTTKFKAVACGVHHYVALDIDGNLWAAGSNEYGQISFNDLRSVNNLSQISSDVEFTTIACGSNHTVALDNNGNLWTCGENVYGQLGQSDNHNCPFLIEISCDAVFIDVSCGIYHTVVLDIDGNVWACGNNEHGQLALNDNIDRNTLTKIPNLKADILWNQQNKPKRRIKSAASTI